MKSRISSLAHELVANHQEHLFPPNLLPQLFSLRNSNNLSATTTTARSEWWEDKDEDRVLIVVVFPCCASGGSCSLPLRQPPWAFPRFASCTGSMVVSPSRTF